MFLSERISKYKKNADIAEEILGKRSWIKYYKT